MKVLVTGGSGFLGRFIVRELSQAHEVVVFDLNPPMVDVGFLKGDIRDVSSLIQAMSGCNRIVHLTALFNKPDHQPTTQEMFEINVQGAFNVLEASRQVKLERVVFASSICAGGTSLKYLPIDENHPPDPGGPGSDFYGMTKYIGETLCRGYHAMWNINTVCLRFGVIKDLSKGFGIEGSSNTLWSYVDVRDAAQAVRLALEVKGIGHEIFYITAMDTFCPHTPGSNNRGLIKEEIPGFDLSKANKFFLESHDSFFSIRKACEILGYKPGYSWRKKANIK